MVRPLEAQATKLAKSMAQRKRKAKAPLSKVPSRRSEKHTLEKAIEEENISSDSEETDHSTSGSNEEPTDEEATEDNASVHRASSQLGPSKRQKHARATPVSLQPGFKCPLPPQIGDPSAMTPWQWVPVSQPGAQPFPWATMAGAAGPAYSTPWQSEKAGGSVRRGKRHDHDTNSAERSGIGKKPSSIHVLASGEIDASSPGKTAWDQSMRSLAPLILDLSIIDWDSHKPHTLKKLRDTLDAEFEYLGNPLSSMGFRNAVKRFLRSERCRLKKIYLANQGEEQEDEEDCPVRVDPQQWQRLKEYWGGSAQLKKSQMMSTVRKQVQNVSKSGRRGKGSSSAAVGSEGKDKSSGVTANAEGLQVSEVAGSSVVSSGIHAKVLALENRQDEFEKFRLEMLASSHRTTTAVEALQKTLMSFLQQGYTVPATGMAPLTTPCAHSPSHPPKVRGTKSYSNPYELHDSIQNVDSVGGQEEAAGDEGKSNTVLGEDKNTFLEEKVHDSAHVSEEKVNDSTAIVDEKVVALVEEKVAAVVEEKVAAAVEEKVAAIVDEKVPTIVEETVAATKDNNIVILQDEDKVVDLVEQPIETSSSLKSNEGGDGARAEDDELAQDRLHAAISTPKVSPRQRLLRKGKDREAKSTVRKELVPKPQLTRTRQTENKKKHKFEIGQTVSLLNPAKPKQVVAVGKIMSVGGGPGPQQYHGSPIPDGWYRLDVVSAQEGSVDLMAPNEAGDEFTVKDVIGGNTIWQEKYIGMAQAGKLVVYKPPK